MALATAHHDLDEGAAAPLFVSDDLTVARRSNPAEPIVAEVALSVSAGGSLGIVGESGSGKSLTCLALVGLLPRPLMRTAGTVTLGRRTLTDLSPRRLARERGRSLALVFQDPAACLNPMRRVGPGLAALLRLHRGLSRRDATAEAARLFDGVGLLPRHLDAYPHELSGGQSQRVLIAGALAGEPSLLIADEPTTALDVTTQAQLLDLIEWLRAETGMALLIVSHDFGVIARSAETVAVMYAGRVVETAPVRALVRTPGHPYTAGLLASVPPERGRVRAAPLPAAPVVPHAAAPGCAFLPRCPRPSARCRHERPPSDGARRESDRLSSSVGRMTILEADKLARYFRDRTVKGGQVRAVDGITLRVARGETLGIVGESGCGKSTLGRLLTGLEAPTTGHVRFEGAEIAHRDGTAFRAARRRIQYVFQHPQAALNPRLTIGFQVAEPVRAHGLVQSRANARQRAAAALGDVGLDAGFADRYGHQLSGGQRQRALLARSLALDPELVVFDEPTSALDLSVQAQVIELIETLRVRRRLTVVVISHDLRVVRVLSDRIAVMYLGVIVEIGAADAVFHTPAHPYAAALLGALLGSDPDAPRSSPLPGEPPNAAAIPSGCRFHPRCPRAAAPCHALEPMLAPLSDGREVACHAVATDAAGMAWPPPAAAIAA